MDVAFGSDPAPRERGGRAFLVAWIGGRDLHPPKRNRGPQAAVTQRGV